MNINSEKIITNFNNKIRTAKMNGMSEIKFSVKELEDVNMVIYQILAEKFDVITEMMKQVKSMMEEPVSDKEVVVSRPVEKTQRILSGGTFK